MSVTVRRHINGGWEVDIRVLLPDGTQIRERKKAPGSSNPPYNGGPKPANECSS